MSKRASAKAWLEINLPSYERFTRILTSLLESLLSNLDIDYLSITGRTKTARSAIEKARRKKYKNIADEMTDISGVRIVCYTENECLKVSEILANYFKIDPKNSLDRSKILGSDKIGYRSIHFVCSLTDDRLKLPEYASFGGLKFEIQLRTVLQHAWAEISHDRAYKFSGVLPRDIQRKLNLYSGTLELVDRGFSEIAAEIDGYSQDTARYDDPSYKQERINSINLAAFLNQFALRSRLNIAEMRIDKDIIDELRSFGIVTLGDLSERLLTFPVDKSRDIYEDDATTTYGFLRDVMMYEDLDKYFEKAYKRNWIESDDNSWDVLRLKYDSAKIYDILRAHDAVLKDDIDGGHEEAERD